MKNPWKDSNHFKEDKIDNPEKTNPELVGLMDLIRDASNCKIIIHRVHDPMAQPSTSRHAMVPCDACDFHMVPLGPSSPQTLFHQFVFLTKIDGVRGLGIYPHWKNKGFHVDMRQEKIKMYWIRDKDGLYLPVTDKTIKLEVLNG